MANEEDLELTLTSDGTAANTHVLDQHGRELKNIVAIRWDIKDPHSLARCTLVLDTILLKFNVKLPAGQVFLRPYPWWRRALSRWRRRHGK